MTPHWSQGEDALSRLSPPEALAREAVMLDRVARRETDSEVLVWSTHPCLVAPAASARLAGFEAGKARIEALGLPLHFRETGGDLMPQGPNVLNVTVAFAAPNRASFGVAVAYDRLCSPFLELLRAHGVAAHCAAVPEAFCDGRFNIAVGGRKLAGTAQRWRTRTRPLGTEEPGVAVLAHVAIFVAADFHRYVEAANHFYATCGLARRVRDEAHAALADLPGFSELFHTPDPLDALAATLRSCYEGAFNANRDARRT